MLWDYIQFFHLLCCGIPFSFNCIVFHEKVCTSTRAEGLSVYNPFVVYTVNTTFSWGEEWGEWEQDKVCVYIYKSLIFTCAYKT